MAGSALRLPTLRVQAVPAFVAAIVDALVGVFRTQRQNFGAIEIRDAVPLPAALVQAAGGNSFTAKASGWSRVTAAGQAIVA